MKTYYSLEIKQKRGDDVVSIEFGIWKRISCKYSKKKRIFKAKLVGFDGESKKIEYVDIISVIKTKRKK